MGTTARTVNSAAISTIGSGRAFRQSTDPTMPNAAPGKPPRGEDPPVFFICTKGGRGGAGPDPHTFRSRKSSIEDPPQFFGQIFWEKILETKILAPLVTIFLATHP